MARLTIAGARALAAEALVRAGCREAIAQTVARALVAAEADGLKGHGMSRLPSYAAQVRVGKIDGAATPRASRPAPGVLRVDAAHGFAYPALDVAVAELPTIARQQGIAAAAITRSHHAGAAGLVVEALAEHRLAALLFANTPGAMAPAGGRRALLGTNPIAFACIDHSGAPLVIDLALSKVARGNIMAAKQRGDTLPEGWARDRDGRPTTDPDEALAGTMEPMGEGKGAVLALMVELLAAALTGARFASEATSFLDDQGSPPGTGQLIIAIDMAALSPRGPMRVAELADLIHNEPGARLPGERRMAQRKRAASEGLIIDDQLISAIRAI